MGRFPARGRKSKAEGGQNDYTVAASTNGQSMAPAKVGTIDSPACSRPRRTAKTAAKEKIVAEIQENRNGRKGGPKASPKKAVQKRGQKSNTPAPEEAHDSEEEISVSSTPATTSPPTKRSRPSEAETEVIQEQIMPTTTSPQIQSSTSKLYEMLTDKDYHDVVLVPSNGKEITTHRCTLAKYSSIFRDRFKASTVLPVKIELPDFHAAIVQSALDFMLEKRDSIIGKEFNLLKFASQFGIRDLMTAASNSIIIDATNVCEIIQVAYENNFEELKQKCLKIMSEKKEEIDRLKVVELPKNIITDAYLF